MKILVLNCGSSSIKYQLLEMENANSSHLLAKGLLERIGLEMGEFTHKYNGEKYYEQLPIPNHTEGIKLVLKALVDPKMGVIKDLKDSFSDFTWTGKRTSWWSFSWTATGSFT